MQCARETTGRATTGVEGAGHDAMRAGNRGQGDDGVHGAGQDVAGAGSQDTTGGGGARPGKSKVGLSLVEQLGLLVDKTSTKIIQRKEEQALAEQKRIVG